MYGIHLQSNINGWTQHLSTLPAGTPVKAVDGVQWLAEAKQHNQNIKTVLRHWYDHGQHYDGAAYSVLLDRSETFFRSFVDGTFSQYAASVDFVETWNETLANSQTPDEKRWRIDQERAMCEVWARDYKPLYPHIRLVLANTAIGNDIPWQYAQLCKDYGHVLGYHSYVGVTNNEVSPADDRWLSGRWRYMDTDYKARGFVVQWIFTEGGACWDRNGAGSLDPNAGWRHDETCGRSLDEYKRILTPHLSSIVNWNKNNNNRCLGGVLFTSGKDEVWDGFNITGAEWVELAQFMRDFKPGNPPIDPPDPPDPTPSTELINGSFEGGWETLPPLPNSLKNQRPNDWQLNIIQPGQVAWDFRNSKLNTSVTVTGWPECVHKLAGQLPPHEKPGGSDPLILDGQTVYKIFSSGDIYGASLKQAFNATGVLKLPIRVHYQGPVNNDSPDTAQIKVLINGVTQLHLNAIPYLPDRKWIELSIPVNGQTELEIRFVSIWRMGIDFFMDNWRIVEGSPPPPTTSIETRVHLLRPRNMTAAQWQKIVTLMTDGISPPLIGRSDSQNIVIGYEGWSHVDAYLAIKQSIEAGKLDSRLIVMDGEQIGTGLNSAWVAANWADIAPYVYFISSGANTTIPPLVATHWPTPHRVVTQQFGANPQNYPQAGLYGHDGTDIRAYHGDSVWCIAPGVVRSIYTNATGHNYGKHVRVNHPRGRDTHQTIYAHLDSISVEPGQIVAGGQELGKADNTGNSFGDHLHLTYKIIGKDYTDPKGNTWGYNIFDSTPILKPLAPELFP